ncbi:MAG: hypothetical protein ABFC54_07505 [Thermoguttaceae bacterium]
MTRKEATWSTLLLAAILGFGVCMVWGFVVLNVFAVLHHFHSETPSISEALVVYKDGRVVIETYIDNNEDSSHARTLDGKSLATFNATKERIPRVLIRGPADLREPTSSNSWASRFTVLADYDKNARYLRSGDWYFVHDGNTQGHGYFAKIHGPQPGYLGRTGFRSDKPPLDDQFAIRTDGSPLLANGYIERGHGGSSFTRLFNDQWNDTVWPLTYNLATDEGLVQVDPKKRSVRRLHAGKPISACIEMRELGDSSLHSAPPETFVLWRTVDRVQVLDFNGKQQEEFRLPQEIRTRDFEWCRLPNDTVLAVVDMPCPSDVAPHHCELYWFTKDGRIVRKETVSLKRDVRITTTLESVAMTCSLPSPGLLLAFGFLSQQETHPSADGWAKLKGTIQEGWPFLLAVEALSLILAVGCFCRQRKFGLSGAWIWAGFMLLFGVPAYLGYRLSRVWPAQLACPHCKQPTPRDRPACLHCGQNFPPPAMKGIEVFA